MGYKVYRMRQKAGTGYDIFHIETNTDLVLRFDSAGVPQGTLEESLQSVESNVSIMSKTIDTLLGNVIDQLSEADGKFISIADGRLIVDSASADAFAKAVHDHEIGDITGAAANRVLITGTDNSVTESTITSTELAALFGIATGSTIQKQLDSKADADHAHTDYVKIDVLGTTVPTMSDGKIESQYLPSYVDDVVEGVLTSTTKFTIDNEEVEPEVGKIYVDTLTNKTYRWSGTIYTAVGGGGVALGETSATAYRGDYGKIAYDHSQSTHARTDATCVAKSTTNGAITINGTAVTVYTHPTYAGTKSTSTASPGYGGTFVALSAVTLSNGHVSAYTAQTVKMPTRPVDISFATSQPTTQQTNDLWFQTL